MAKAGETGKKIRLDRFLVDSAGVSRNEAKQLIRGGRVWIGTEAETDPGAKILPGVDPVLIDGTPVHFQKFYYYLMNKPAGVITSTEKGPQKTVLDVLREILAEREEDCPHFDKLSPVGRLDKDTEGLLVLTDDGAMLHRLLAPGKHVPKVYEALVAGTLDETAVKSFRNGLDLGDFTSAPAELVIGERETEGVRVRVRITEGKFHQVKRMFEAVGCQVLTLKRIRMGDLDLPEDLRTGDARPMREEELALLQMQGAADQ